MSAITNPGTNRATAMSWQRTGGGSFLIASGLLLVATFFEYPSLEDPAFRGAAFWTFAVLFSVSAILFLLASVVLVHGDGIVGDSMLGRAGFIGFGIFWLLAQSLYLVSSYALTANNNAPAAVLSTVFSGVFFVSAVIAAAVVAVKHVATGLARWSLIGALIISAVTTSIAGTGTSPILITVMHALSTVAFIVVAISYLRSGRRH